MQLVIDGLHLLLHVLLTVGHYRKMTALAAHDTLHPVKTQTRTKRCVVAHTRTDKETE